ncbi:hypothetical protein KFK09_014293 [Dendrobium nobile]|uniref:Uncharacterized protein n=1 Tax=Dendrobium nobile TaxID=94219 RepID=A0A8T3BF81_DENNO|nr:hypothetical protein KFK09_014293 [Dendrobium nobile]
MEGLISLIYSAIRRKKTRRHYKPLSSSTEAMFGDSEHQFIDHGFLKPSPEKNGGQRKESWKLTSHLAKKFECRRQRLLACFTGGRVQ